MSNLKTIKEKAGVAVEGIKLWRSTKKDSDEGHEIREREAFERT